MQPRATQTCQSDVPLGLDKIQKRRSQSLHVLNQNYDGLTLGVSQVYTKTKKSINIYNLYSSHFRGTQMRFPLKWLLFNRWLWITIFGMSAIVIGPFIALFGMLALPMQYRGLATFAIIFAWSIAAGYKDWVISKRQEEKLKMRARI